jgi:hypothetical protein
LIPENTSTGFAVILQLKRKAMDQQEIQEKEMMKFSWTGLFLVTGFSSFIFSAVMKVLDGDHSRFLVLIGVAGVSLGLLNWVLNQTGTRKRKNEQPSL